MQVYISRGGEQIGAWTAIEVRQFYEAGQLLPTDKYWCAGMSEWKSLESLVPAPKPASPTQVPVAPLEPIPPAERIAAVEPESVVPIAPVEPEPVEQIVRVPPMVIPLPSRPPRDGPSVLSSIVEIIVPLAMAGGAAYLIGPLVTEATPAGQVEVMAGTVTFIAGIAFLIAWVFPVAWRLAARCGLVIVIAFLTWSAKENLATEKALAEINAYTAEQRQDRSGSGQSAQRGNVDVDGPKTGAELAKLRDLSDDDSDSDKIKADTKSDIMGQVATKRQAILDKEHPAMALGLSPSRLNSLEDLEERRAALQACQPPLNDMVTFLKNIDTITRNSLRWKGLNSSSIDAYLRDIHDSEHLDALASYWQLETAILADYLANMDLLKANWGKWHSQENAVLFDDDATAGIYNANLKKLKDDVAQQQAAQKILNAALPPQ